MTTNGNSKPPVLVVLQLTGGNDYFNTVIPYTDGNYYDSRPSLQIPQDRVLKLNDELGLHPAMAPLKDKFEQGDVAIIHGVGYANSPRSHFRSMDIWHTCEPDTVGTEGWLARAIRDIDPESESPITAVNIGQGLPRALVARGVSVASVADLATYGLLTSIEQESQRTRMLERFANMYGPAVGTGQVMEYLGQTGLDALKGADILKTATETYTSTVEYAATPIAQSRRGISQVLLKGLGTRVFYTSQGGYDTHANQTAVQTPLLSDLSAGIGDFFADLKEHDAADNVLMLVFTEFGRRVKDNGSGSDHGSGGGSYIIGQAVHGGMHGTYPSLREEDRLDGDLQFPVDFRSVYSTIVERWMGLDGKSVTGGSYEHLDFV